MTATLTPGPAPAPGTTEFSPDHRGLQVTQLRVIRSEWTKFHSLRSTVYTLVLAAVLMIGLGARCSPGSPPADLTALMPVPPRSPPA